MKNREKIEFISQNFNPKTKEGKDLKETMLRLCKKMNDRKESMCKR